MRAWIGTLLVVGAALAPPGCGDDDGAPPPFEHQTFYATLSDEVSATTYRSGQWFDDYGDAAFYGTAHHAWLAAATGDASAQQVADEATQYLRTVLADADILNGDVNEIAMAALGLIDVMAAHQDLADLDVLDPVLDNIDDAVEVLGYYLDGGVIEGYAVETYGPTSISGLVGLLNAQYAYLLRDAPARERRLAWARAMAEALDEQAWNGTYYAFGSGREGLYLYPNLTLILLNARLYQLTGEGAYRRRALDVYDAIQALKVTDDGPGQVRYKSPYSAVHMGAQTDDYTTLSSQNYTLFALLLLHEITGRAAFLAEWNGIVEFLSQHLHGTWCHRDIKLRACEPACASEEACVDGLCVEDACQPGVIHHFMDGAPALPEHPEYYCSGCNLQLLYVLWYRQHRLPTPMEPH